MPDEIPRKIAPRPPESYVTLLELLKKVTRMVREELIESLKPSLRDLMATFQTMAATDGTHDRDIKLQHLITYSKEFEHPLIDGYLLEEVANALADDGEWIKHGDGVAYRWSLNPQWAKSHAA